MLFIPLPVRPIDHRIARPHHEADGRFEPAVLVEPLPRGAAIEDAAIGIAAPPCNTSAPFSRNTLLIHARCGDTFCTSGDRNQEQPAKPQMSGCSSIALAIK
jgi:hypothetical protein